MERRTVGTLVIRCLMAATLFAATGAATSIAAAQDYPSKPIRMIVPFPPGNGTDVLARLIADKISASMKQDVIVENMAGGNGVIAAGLVAREAADGYTILIAGTSLTVLPYVVKDLQFDPKKELRPFAVFAEASPALIVPGKSAIKSIDDLVAKAKADPSKVMFGSSNNSAQFAAQLFKHHAKIDFVTIPYKGTQQAYIDLISERITLMFAGVATTAPLLEDNSLRALAVASRKRLKAYPDLPTMDEKFPGLVSVVWLGAAISSKTPEDIAERLNKEINAAIRLPDVTQRMVALGYEPQSMGLDEVDRYIDDERALWEKTIKETNWNIGGE